MLTNAQMTANRFARWAKARAKLAKITEAMNAGATITVTTYGRQLRLTAKHADMLKATKTGLYVQRGKAWDCIDGAKIQAWR